MFDSLKNKICIYLFVENSYCDDLPSCHRFTISAPSLCHVQRFQAASNVGGAAGSLWLGRSPNLKMFDSLKNKMYIYLFVENSCWNDLPSCHWFTISALSLCHVQRFQAASNVSGAAGSLWLGPSRSVRPPLVIGAAQRPGRVGWTHGHTEAKSHMVGNWNCDFFSAASCTKGERPRQKFVQTKILSEILPL